MNDEIESMRKCNKCKSSFTLVNFNMNSQGEYSKTIRGSSYIPTPAKFASSNSGLINIKNSDDKCFKWCMVYHQSNKLKYSNMLSVLNKVEDKYNYEGANFPTSYEDIKKFEENNKVCVNVYATKKENEETIIVKEMLGNPDYFLNDNINLLRITDEDEYEDEYEDEEVAYNSHYVYIKNLSTLLYSQRQRENIKCECGGKFKYRFKLGHERSKKHIAWAALENE